MRMTDAILPGSPPPGNIKRLCVAPSTSFRFSCASSKDRSAYTTGNIPPSLTLSIPGRFQQQTEGLFIERESTFNICSSASFRRPFLINYFSLQNQMDLEAYGWVLNSCTAIYNCPSSIIIHSSKENFVSSCHLSFHFENYQYFRQRLHYLFSFFWYNKRQQGLINTNCHFCIKGNSICPHVI